jgi:hypothetical protein
MLQNARNLTSGYYPPAHVHVDQFLAQYSSLLGWVVVALGVFYIVYGVRHYARLRPASRSLAHVTCNVVVSGIALYLVFGAVQSSTAALADFGFLFAHVIVVGMLTALVSGAVVAFARQPDAAARARRAFWPRRFVWGLFAGFVAGPIVGTLAELVLAGSPALGFSPPGRSLLLLGDVFGIVAGWFVVAPITGLLNMARVRLEEGAARLPAQWAPSAGTALALFGIVLAGFSPFSPETAHAVAHAIILPLVSR